MLVDAETFQGRAVGVGIVEGPRRRIVGLGRFVKIVVDGGFTINAGL